ncbi:MAG: hypothetical protein WCD80_11825 [Desulfobaccales bacterium]
MGTAKPALTGKGAIKVIMTLMVLAAFSRAVAYALPPAMSPPELQKRSDLVIEGRVTKVWPYSQWLASVQNGGWGKAGEDLLRQAPATDREMLQQVRNFPYKGSRAVVDGVYLAEVQVARVLKGEAKTVIFIPFVRYHFLPGQMIIGGWSERNYQQGDHLQMYLIKNGPFFESTWWNAASPMP